MSLKEISYWMAALAILGVSLFATAVYYPANVDCEARRGTTLSFQSMTSMACVDARAPVGTK